MLILNKDILKYRFMVTIFFTLISFCMISIPSFAGPVLIDGILAVVNGEIITLSDLLIREKRLLDAENSPQKLDADSRKRIRERILQDLIDEILMIKEAERTKMSPTKEEIVQQIDQIKRENRLNSDEALDSVLAQEGITREALEKNIYEEISLLRIHQRILHQNVKVTDQEIQGYYDTEWTGNKEGMRVEISHILFKPLETEKEIQERTKRIIREWEEGKSFAELASKYSQDASASEGGYLGWFYVENLRPEFAEALRGIQAGKITGPVKTDIGYHILFVSQRKSPGLEKGSPIWEKIKETLTERKRTDAFEIWIERLRKRASIEINEDVLARNQ